MCSCKHNDWGARRRQRLSLRHQKNGGNGKNYNYRRLKGRRFFVINEKKRGITTLLSSARFVQEAIGDLLSASELTPMRLYKFCCCYIGVNRSRKIESDRDYQKNKQRVQELTVLWKNEKSHSTISMYIETFDTNTIIRFYFTNGRF